MQIKSVLNGKEINLTGDNATIISNNFNVDKNGNLTCNNAKMKNSQIEGGNLKIWGNTNLDGARVFQDSSMDTSHMAYMVSNVIGVNDGDNRAAMSPTAINIGQSTMFPNYITTSGPVYAENISSDRRLKENIKDSTINATEVINNLKIRSFDWKKDKRHVEAGIIAQEAEKVDENFVLKRPIMDEEKNIVDYQYYINELPIINTLIKSVQELSKQNGILQSKLKEVEEKVNEIN